MILISNDFWHNRKMHNFDPYNATNIAVLLMTAFMLQSHIIHNNCSTEETNPCIPCIYIFG